MAYLVEIVIALLITDNIRLRVSRHGWVRLVRNILAHYREAVGDLQRWNAEEEKLVAHMERECGIAI